MQTPTFTPRAPKPAIKVTCAELIRLVRAEQLKVTGDKRVGPGMRKVFTSGAHNYYVNDSARLTAFLGSLDRPA